MGQNNLRGRRVRRRRILGSKTVYRDDSMMAALVAAGLRQWDNRWLYLNWLERAACLALLTSFLSLTEPGLTNPTGGQVVSGTATIGTPTPSTLQVDQHTKIVIIDWSSFNIASGETTSFNQPDASSMAVNRIGGNDPSQILGSLLANGRIVLINGDGIIFGPNAQIDVGSLLATTSDASDQDIASGKATFGKAGNPNAMIVNQGSINASSGLVGLIAPAVRNDGIITARLGSVTLGASNVFTVDFTGDGLISFPLDANIVSRAIDANGKPVEALVVNNGRIVGSTVLLSARAARDLVTNVISMGGTIAATSVSQNGGEVVLDGGDGGVLVNGTIMAVGRTGGDISITGGDIKLSHATLDASGTQGGGKITVGNWSARSVAVDSATSLSASALTNGNGGSISVIAGQTQFAGQADARGGAAGGNGGSVETSGHSLDIAGAQVDTSAPAGAAGNWLLDPDDYTIDAAQAATIEANLASGNVTIMTTASGTGGNGDIFVDSAISWSSANSLTLSAYRNIAVNANITVSGGGALSLATGTGGSGDYSIASGGSISFTGGPSSGASLSINGNPYTLLYSMSDVQAINASNTTLQGNYALATSLDASSTSSWVPIGTDGAGNISNSGNGFIGVFTGLGNTISNLTINLLSSNYVGLFGYSSGTIRDIGMVGGSVSGRRFVGGLVGYNGGTIEQSYATGVVSAGDTVGGLVGFNNGGTIEQSYATGAVSGGEAVGGLVGVNYFGGVTIITQSYATGAVSGTGLDVGGLVGINRSTITDSYATGAVSGTSGTSGDVGGLAGWNWGGTIMQSYATGAVSSDNAGGYLGGLVGGMWGGTITQSYATGAVYGGGGGLVGDIWSGTVTQSYATGAVYGGGGGLVGENDAGTIMQSYATGAVYGGGGGLVGNNNGTITLSYATGAVYGGGGGLVGGNGGTITQSFATGAVSGPGDYVGGLVGNNFGTITQSYATGAVNGPGVIGGLVGFNHGGTITQSYATGAVNGPGVIGGLVGFNHGGTITQSYATGAVNGAGVVGGLVGINEGTVTKSYATGAVSGTDIVGGLVGWNRNSGTITQSYATGAVNSSGYDVGGLVGENDGTITQSYATGAVSGYNGVGGLVGDNYGTITQSYATGAVSGTDQVGGLVGYNGGTITLSYWDTQSSGQSNGVGAGDASGATGLTTAQLSNGTLPNGFDPAAWRTQSRYYPCLLWQASCIAAIPAVTTITYVIDDSSSVYGTLAVLGAVTLTGVSAGDLANVTPVVSLYDSSNSAVTLSAALNAGTYTEKVTSLTGSAAGNYTIALTGNTDGILIVNPAPLIVAVNDASRTYGDANPAFTATITGFVLGQDASVLTGLTFSTVATQSSDVGSYAITSSGGTATNYVITTRIDGTLTINPAQLTVAVNDASRTYGDANPALTATITGFVLGQDASVLSGLTFSTAATQGSDLGTYAITSSGGTATNYVIVSRTDGTLTITPRISWTNQAAIEALRLENHICNDNDPIADPFCPRFGLIDIGNLSIANDDILACIVGGDLIDCRARAGRL